jgi:hypothetical protein
MLHAYSIRHDRLRSEKSESTEEPYSPLIDEPQTKPKHLLMMTNLHNITFRAYDNSLGYTIVSSITPWKKDLVSILTILIKSDVAIEWRNYHQPEFIFSKHELWVHNNNIMRAKWAVVSGTYKSRLLVGNICIGKLDEWYGGEFIPDVVLIPKSCRRYQDTIKINLPNAMIEHVEPLDTSLPLDLSMLGGAVVVDRSMLDCKLALSKNLITSWLAKKE